MAAAGLNRLEQVRAPDDPAATASDDEERVRKKMDPGLRRDDGEEMCPSG